MVKRKLIHREKQCKLPELINSITLDEISFVSSLLEFYIRFEDTGKVFKLIPFEEQPTLEGKSSSEIGEILEKLDAGGVI